MEVSYVFLTFNRLQSADDVLTKNTLNAGYPFELVHVDNGSYGFRSQWKHRLEDTHTLIKFSENQGLYRAYNIGFAAAKGPLIALTDPDIIMPKDWLKKMVEAHKAIPETGMVCCYAETPGGTRDLEALKKGKPYVLNGIEIQECYPHGPRLFSKKFLHDVGYFHEGFSPYGLGDIEWSDRVRRVSKEKGYLNYMLPALGTAVHLPEEDNMVGGMPYREWKIKQREGKPELLAECRKAGLPVYNPFS